MAATGAATGGATTSLIELLTANSDRPVTPTSSTHSRNCQGSATPAHRQMVSARSRRSASRLATVTGRCREGAVGERVGRLPGGVAEQGRGRGSPANCPHRTDRASRTVRVGPGRARSAARCRCRGRRRSCRAGPAPCRPGRWRAGSAAGTRTRRSGRPPPRSRPASAPRTRRPCPGRTRAASTEPPPGSDRRSRARSTAWWSRCTWVRPAARVRVHCGGSHPERDGGVDRHRLRLAERDLARLHLEPVAAGRGGSGQHELADRLEVVVGPVEGDQVRVAVGAAARVGVLAELHRPLGRRRLLRRLLAVVQVLRQLLALVLRARAPFPVPCGTGSRRRWP